MFALPWNDSNKHFGQPVAERIEPNEPMTQTKPNQGALFIVLPGNGH
jgi:hypothetical protein